MNFLTLFYRSLGIFIIALCYLTIHVLGLMSYHESWLPRGADFGVLTVGATFVQLTYLIVHRYFLRTTEVFWSKAFCWGAFSAFIHGVCVALAYAGSFAVQEPMLFATVGYTVLWALIFFTPKMFLNPNRNMIRGVILLLGTAILPVYIALSALLGLLFSLKIGVPVFMSIPFIAMCIWMARTHYKLRHSHTEVVTVQPSVEVVNEPMDIASTASVSNPGSNSESDRT